MARSRAALLLAVLAAGGALSMATSPPFWWMWQAHFVALETSLLTALLAAAALGAASPALSQVRRPSELDAYRTAVLALPALVVALLPVLAALPVFLRTGAPFSLRSYVLGLPHADVGLRRDLVLDPARPALTADLYQPRQPGRYPLVVVLHGGSWRGGDKGQASSVSAALAAEGLVVADVRYRLAPTDPFPAAVADVKCLLGRLRAQADAFGLDGRVALLGRSAGGQIALVAAYSAGDPRMAPSCAVDDRGVDGVIGLYAPTDLAWGHAAPVRPDVVHGPRSLEMYLGGTPEGVPETYRLATPQSWLERPVPPTLLVHGTGDRLVAIGHERRLAAALAAHGAAVEVLEIPLAEHAFDVRPGGLGEQLARHAIVRWLRRLYGMGS